MKNIFVTQPTLPSLAEFIPYLEKIWENKILTNGGPFHQQLETTMSTPVRTKYKVAAVQCQTVSNWPLLAFDSHADCTPMCTCRHMRRAC